LRAELLQKSSDAQSSIKKVSAPTVPLRSRGMPRKMTDTTPMKGIPSRVPTSGFRSPPASQNQQRPSASRTTAGRKDGGIKLLDITEQPLGYAAAKKRKRQQDLEEQAKKAQEVQSAQEANLSVKSEPNSSANEAGAAALTTTTTPDYAAGLAPSTVYSQPATPLTSMVSSTSASATIKMEVNNQLSSNTNNNNDDGDNDMMEVDANETLNDEETPIINIKMEPPATPQTLNTTNKVNISEHKLLTSNVPKLASISPQTPTLTSISSSSAPNSTIKIVKIEQPDSSPSAGSAATINKIITMTTAATTRPVLTRTTFAPASTQQTIIMSSSNKTATIGGRTLTFTANTPVSIAPTASKQPKLSTQEIKQEIKYVTKTIAAPTIQKAGGQTTITQENLQKILSQANLILTKTGTTSQNPQHATNSPTKNQQPMTQFTIQQQPQQSQQQRILTSTSTLPTLTTTISRSQLQHVRQQQLQQQQTQIAKQSKNFRIAMIETQCLIFFLFIHSQLL
jgi:negative elongation factor A